MRNYLLNRIASLIAWPLALATGLYSGGGCILLWVGLPLHYLSWGTFIVVNLEFFDNDNYQLIILFSWIVFFLTIFTSIFFIRAIKRNYQRYE